jgi:hypothetical protein
MTDDTRPLTKRILAYFLGITGVAAFVFGLAIFNIGLAWMAMGVMLGITALEVWTGER